MQIKQKLTNKTKTIKQKTINATLFCAEKPVRGGKLSILRFSDFFKLKNFSKKKKKSRLKIVLIALFTILLACSPINLLVDNLFVLT